MKLHTLELTGFGPFRETQRVDFDAFDGDGVFLITGRTGTGKSSILDGVSFALYGTVPRYDGGDKRLRSDHSHLTDPTEVRLEFTVGGARWRVTRAPEYDRPAKRGGGLTTETARAQLDELVDGVWVGRAAKPRDVGVALGEMLGVNAQQFQQVILLAQNKFSRFLLAPGDERQRLLRTLFGTQRFEQYRDDLEQRRRDAQRSLDTAGEHARTLLELAERIVDEQLRASGGPAESAEPQTPASAIDLSARRGALAAAQRRADYRVEQSATQRAQADAAAAAAGAAHGALVERAQRGRERAAARERLDALAERAPQIAEERLRLARGAAAEALRATLETADRAEDAHRRAAEAEGRALSAWVEAGGPAAVAADDRVEELTADLARWEDALEIERRHAQRLDRRTMLAAERERQDSALAELDARRAALPAARAELDAAIDLARADAARRDDLQARRAELAAQWSGAREAAALADEVRVADTAHLAANATAAAAVGEVTELLQRRLAGFAGELSAALVDGRPCTVCGSTDHPHPAPPSVDPVTDEDLAAAEAARDRAHAAAAAAAEAARSVHARLNAAQATAGGQDEPQLADQVAQVTTEIAAAEAAHIVWERCTAERDGLDALSAAADSERAALIERQSDTRAAHAVTETEITRADAAIAAARGTFDTVADRAAALVAERARARALADARRALAERDRALTAAREDRDARLGASDFSDPDEARAALIDAAETAQLAERIDAYTADLTSTKARLLELELSAIGDDVTEAELTASAATVTVADDDRTAAIAGERDAQLTAGRLRELAARVDEAYASVADVADDAAAVTRLADTVAGRAPNTMKMDLETFVLAAELEEIVAAANVRLSEMSSGRYSLHHSDARAARGRASGLGIDVLDAHTGRLRSPQSLSGGETFLASLALALGLGEVVTARAGGIRLDTLFVDEGFGSLDPETLELAMRTLDELRAGGRTVGVISHVEAMKDQLPAQLVVEATPGGPSVIRQAALGATAGA